MTGPIDQYAPDIATASQQYHVPAPILRNLLLQENGGKAVGTSSKGAQGIAQMMPATARALGVNPNDPHQAIPASAKYLSQLYGRFGNWDQALAAYNAGPGNVHAAIEAGGPAWEQHLPDQAQTVPYIRNITSGVPGYNPTAPDAGLDAQAPGASNADPIADLIARQPGAPSNAQPLPDPVAGAAAAQGVSLTPSAMPTPAQEAKDYAARIAQNYQSMDFPTRAFVNAGNAMTGAVRGAGGLLADAGVALGMPGASQWRQNLLAAQQQSDQAMAPATLRDPATWVGNALPLAATAPLGAVEAGARGLGALATRGALAGGALGALQEGSGGPAQSLSSELEQRGVNALASGALGAPLGVLGGLVGRGINALRGTGAQGESLAKEAASTGVGPVQSLAAPSATPQGYAPTAAEQTGNAQLIQLQRALQAQGSDALTTRFMENQGALNQAWNSLRGTPQQVAQAQQALDANATQWYADARANLNNPTGAVDGAALANNYDALLQKYGNDKTVLGALQKYATGSGSLPGVRGNPAPWSPFSGVGGAPDGGYITDPNQLVQVRNSINADLDKQFTTDEAGTVARRAAPALMQLRNSIDQQLGAASPDYLKANTLYAQAKAPINRMRLLQSVSNNIDPTGTADVSTPTLRRALATVTGTANDAGYSLADDVDPQSAQQLQDLYLTAARRDAVMRGAQTGATSKATYNALQQTGMRPSPQGGSGALPAVARATGWLTGNPLVGEGAARTLGGVSNALSNPGSPARLAQQDALREAMENYLLNNPQATQGLGARALGNPVGNFLVNSAGQLIPRGMLGDATQGAYQVNPLVQQPPSQQVTP